MRESVRVRWSCLAPSNVRCEPQPYITRYHERHDINTGDVPDQFILVCPVREYYWMTTKEQRAIRLGTSVAEATDNGDETDQEAIGCMC